MTTCCCDPDLTTLPHSVVPLAGKLVQHFWIIVEQDVEDVLVGQLDLALELVVHGHVGSCPAIRDVSHLVEVHVHDASIESCLAIEGNLVPGSVVMIETGSHGCHVLGGEVIKE